MINKQCYLVDIQLRSYQLDGVNWLIQRYRSKHGCILGDEMGLGKTCQTIALLAFLRSQKGNSAPCLVVSPLSVLANWQNELARFLPDTKVTCYVGDKSTRESMQHPLTDSNDTGVVVTTYEICLKDASFLRSFSWLALVVDEAHRLKNRESQLHQTLLDFHIDHRVLLTGTPVQNNLRELYALLSFVAPHIFLDRYTNEFVERYSEVTDSSGVSELHRLLHPFLLRRTKAEVVKDLPTKSEVVLYHGMSAVQKKYYKAILTKDVDAFENTYVVSKTRLMNILMELRKCVNHPYLFDGVEPEPFQLGEHLVEASGKLVLIDRLLTYLKARGHKVLLFSQMTRMLDILQDYLGYRGYTYERLDGSVRGEERYLAVQNFSENSNTFVFLLSTRAGGQGLNLVAADTVIFVDSDFNPQNDLQAAARAHRIGQTRPVKVIRLLGRNTVEEIILKRAETKLQLTSAVIEGGHFSLGANKDALIADNNMQLQDILKFGVDKLLENETSSLESTDFDHMLGLTSGGQWQKEQLVAVIESTPKSADHVVDKTAEENSESEAGPSMYMFEGKNYAKESSAADKKAFDQLLTAQIALRIETSTSDRPLRRNKLTTLAGPLPELPRKPRRQMTPAELEERRRKRAENVARRAAEAEEEEIRIAQEMKTQRTELWARNSYVSCNLSTGGSDGETDSGEEEEEDDTVACDIQYIVGDVTHPQHSGNGDTIAVHCVDDSGRWGQGGLFSALSRRSSVPEDQYTLAGRMKDLALGDVHLVAIDDRVSRDGGHDYCALIVAQHRGRQNNLSGIKLTALSEGLMKLYKAARDKKASVHLARIGHNTPSFNWYGTERLIRKHLASRGIPTYIYYFSRKQAQKRKTTEENVASTSRDMPTSGKSRRKTGGATSGRLPHHLPNFMADVAVYFHNVPDDRTRKLSRYLVAYNGDIHGSVQKNTVVVTTSTSDDKHLQNLLQSVDAEGGDCNSNDVRMEGGDFNSNGVTVVTVQWLEDCLTRGKLLDTAKYHITADT
ncbi:Chromodomain-helicase-DNA-binding protein 1-like [Lamellibrachia satsuma]|nr:Chromodomain-helicase-DNA-binding protein 1-like [Lamellibrachia satsuma]